MIREFSKYKCTLGVRFMLLSLFYSLSNYIAEVDCNCIQENKDEFHTQASNHGVKINGESEFGDDLCIRYIQGTKETIKDMICVIHVDEDSIVGIEEPVAL